MLPTRLSGSSEKALAFEEGSFLVERISIHANVCHGQACIAATRIPVPPAVWMFANGGTAITDLFRPCRGLALVG